MSRPLDDRQVYLVKNIILTDFFDLSENKQAAFR